MYKNEHEEKILNNLIKVKELLEEVIPEIRNTDRKKDDEDFYLKNIFDEQEDELVLMLMDLKVIINNLKNK